MEARAIAKGVRVSPYRARLISTLIRGKKTTDALAILENVNNKSAKLTKKVLDSAIANAVNNEKADPNTLYIKEARVDAGPVMKRGRFLSRARVGHNYHRTSHIVIVVATKN